MSKIGFRIQDLEKSLCFYYPPNPDIIDNIVYNNNKKIIYNNVKMTEQRVLVTGGSGLVGKAIEHIEKDKKEVKWKYLSSKDVDLTIESDVLREFDNYKPTIVIHLASKVAGLYGNMENNYSMLVDNLKMHTNVLEACRKYKVSKLVNILSTCVFPDKDITYPLTSDQIMNGAPHPSNEGYAYSKRFLLTGSELLSKATGLEVVNITPTNLYGEYDNYHLQKSHVIPGLIHKCYLAKANGDAFVIKGSGKAKRQFVYTKDFAKIILHFVNRTEDRSTVENIIVSPDKESEITIRELVECIAKGFDFKGEIIYDTNFSDGQLSKTCDSSELLKSIPNFEFTSMENGLQSTIDYFVNNYDKVRK
jgi:GDP-L-fucose synthase